MLAMRYDTIASVTDESLTQPLGTVHGTAADAVERLFLDRAWDKDLRRHTHTHTHTHLYIAFSFISTRKLHSLHSIQDHRTFTGCGSGLQPHTRFN